MDGEKRFSAIGALRGIAHRPTDGEAMREADEAVVVAGRGIDSENRKQGQREITLISAESWTDVCRELGATIPWFSRRANLLIEGIDLGATIGSELRIGEVRIRVHGETKPCNIMESQHAGLRDALKPDCRGGVYGEVLSGGRIRVGDRVERVADEGM